MPSLRELLPAVKAFWGGIHPLYPFLERLVEVVEPEDTELAEVKAGIERLHKQSDEWAEKAVASTGAGRLFVVPNEEFVADAELGRLVRGMAPTTSLRTTSTPEEGKSAWVSFRWSATGWKRASTISIDPAEALRAIQQKKPQE